MTNQTENVKILALEKELAKVKKEASHLKTIINQSPAIAFSWKNEEKWTVEFVSENVVSLGYTPDDFYSGRVLIKDIVHPEDRKGVLHEALQLSLKAERDHFHQEYRVICRDGSFIWVDARIIVLRDKGVITSFQGIVLDITEQKNDQLEKFASKNILCSIIDNLPPYIFWKDRDSRYLGCNIGFSRDCGYENPKDILGKTDEEFDYSSEDNSFIRQTDLEVMDSGQPLLNYIYEDPRPNRGSTILKINKMPLHDNDKKIIGVIGTAENITEQIRAEKALAESEIKYRNLFHSANDAIFLQTIGSNGAPEKILDVNSVACKTFGYSKNEFLQLSPAQLIGNDPNVERNRELSLSPQQGKQVFEMQFVSKTGESIPTEVSSTIFSLNGEKFLTYIIRNITQRRKNEELLAKHHIHLEEQVLERTRELTKAKEQTDQANQKLGEQWNFLKTLIDHIPSLIYAKDTDSRFIIANKATVKHMNKRSYVHVVGKTDFDFYPHETAKTFFADEQQLLSTQNPLINKEEHSFNSKNKDCWFLTSKMPFYNKYDELSGLIGIGHDISDMKLAEKERELLTQKAEAASHAKSAFLANMSHEIRTPMNGVIGMASLLRNSQLSPEQQQYADTISRSGELLLSIINNILDFSKIEAGRFELENKPFELRLVLDNLCDQLATAAATKRLMLSCFAEPEIPSFLIGDPGRLQQILLNLVSNGIKFTDQGEVKIRVTTHRVYDDSIVLQFTVWDSGIGLSSEDLPKLFTSFSQIDSATTRKFEGTGLGLAISKELCQLMGGSISVSSNLGEGSQFRFTACFKQATNLKQQQPRIKLHGCRVLVAVSNHINREILSKQVESWGGKVTIAKDTTNTHALDITSSAENNYYDFVFVDDNTIDKTVSSLQSFFPPAKNRKTQYITLSTQASTPHGELLSHNIQLTTITLPLRYRDLKRCFSEPNDLPVHYNESKVAAKRQQTRTSPHPCKILLAEDNLINQQVAVGILAKKGFSDVFTVANGKEAISALNSEPFDIVLMDISMPIMDGFAATKTIRESSFEHNSRHIPIIAVTAHAVKGDMDKCLAMGMSDYLAKPLQPDELSELIHYWTNRTESQHQYSSPHQQFLQQGTEEIFTFNLQALFDRLLNDSGLTLTVIETFLDDTPHQIAILEEHLAEKQFTQAKHQSHKLKGAAANVEAKYFCTLAGSLEILCQNSELVASQEKTEALKYHFTLLAEAMRMAAENLKSNHQSQQ